MSLKVQSKQINKIFVWRLQANLSIRPWDDSYVYANI